MKFINSWLIVRRSFIVQLPNLVFLESSYVWFKLQIASWWGRFIEFVPCQGTFDVVENRTMYIFREIELLLQKSAKSWLMRVFFLNRIFSISLKFYIFSNVRIDLRSSFAIAKTWPTLIGNSQVMIRTLRVF